MTDNEIIETWKKIQDILKKTENVVLQKEPIDDLVRHITNILDLINRQQAEIDRLEKDSKRLKKVQMQLDDAMKMYNVIKAEAYKEFAERSEKEIFIKQDDERKQMLKILKTYRGTRAYSDTEQSTDNWLRGYGEAVQDILSINNNLLKEMVGDNNA